MKIAFDVKGTLDGPRGFQVRKLLYDLHQAGHQIFIWSNSIDYAVEEKKKHDLEGIHALIKFAKSDVDLDNKDRMMDLCIEDDRRQDYLGAYKILYVHQLLDSFQDNKNLVQTLLEDIKP